MTDSESATFNLNSTEGEFKSRCDDVFAGLASLEKKHEAFATVQSRNRSPNERETLTKPDPREDPVQPNNHPSFRRPQGRGARRQRYRPGFNRNPGKWTSYDLSDVSRDQLSDKSNTAAALQFLEERRQAKESPEERKPADLSQKVEFSYPSKVKEGESKADSAAKKFRDGKLVMPEYDMGRKNVKAKRRKVDLTGESSGSGAVNLEYLQEDDEDDSNSEHTKSTKAIPKKDKHSEEEIQEKTFPKQESGEHETEMDTSDKGADNSESGSSTKSEVKFKKVSGKRGIRRRQVDEEDDD